jgi:fatty acid desaturase
VFFPLLTLEGLNMHAASPRWLFHARCRRLRRTELLLLLAHVLAYPGAVLWVLRRSRRWPSSPCIRRYSGSTWAARSHRTTRACRSSVRSRNSTTYATKSSHRANVRGDWFVDQVLGGLNYQIEHHLFPSMPRSHLRNAQRLVQAYCAQHQIPYTETGLFASYACALRYLHALGEPLRASHLIRSKA